MAVAGSSAESSAGIAAAEATVDATPPRVAAAAGGTTEMTPEALSTEGASVLMDNPQTLNGRTSMPPEDIDATIDRLEGTEGELQRKRKSARNSVDRYLLQEAELAKSIEFYKKEIIGAQSKLRKIEPKRQKKERESLESREDELATAREIRRLRLLPRPYRVPNETLAEEPRTP